MTAPAAPATGVRPVRVWAARNAIGEVAASTCRQSQANVKEAAEAATGKHWGLLEAIGWRIARVRITEIPGDDDAR